MKTKKSHFRTQKRQDLMTAILEDCRGYKIGDKVDGAVSEQVETGLNCSLVICDYRKVQELYDTPATPRFLRHRPKIREHGNF